MGALPFDLEELKIFRQQCLRFTQDHLVDHVYEWEEAGLFRASCIKRLLGPVFGGILEELGGAGGDILYPFVAAEAMLTAGSTGTVGLQSHGIAIPPF